MDRVTRPPTPNQPGPNESRASQPQDPSRVVIFRAFRGTRARAAQRAGTGGRRSGARLSTSATVGGHAYAHGQRTLQTLLRARRRQILRAPVRTTRTGDPRRGLQHARVAIGSGRRGPGRALGPAAARTPLPGRSRPGSLGGGNGAQARPAPAPERGCPKPSGRGAGATSGVSDRSCQLERPPSSARSGSGPAATEVFAGPLDAFRRRLAASGDRESNEHGSEYGANADRARPESSATTGPPWVGTGLAIPRSLHEATSTGHASRLGATLRARLVWCGRCLRERALRALPEQRCARAWHRVAGERG